MTDFVWLRTFVAIYRARGLSRAAAQLGLTQPAISQHLRALEAQMGAPLFHRHARGVEPTVAADQLAAWAAEHVDALSTIPERMRAEGESLEGLVRIGAPADILSIWGARAFSRLTRQPGLVIRTVSGTSTAVLDDLHRGALHLAVIERATATPGLEFELALTSPLILLTSARRGRELRTIRDAAARARALSKGPIWAYQEEMPVVRAFFETGFGIRIEEPPAVVLPDYRGLAEGVLAGDGITVVPKIMADRYLAPGSYAAHAPTGPVAEARVYLGWRRGTRASPRLGAVRAALLAQLREPRREIREPHRATKKNE